MVDGAALEKRCAKAPRVRIPPSPPHARALDRVIRALGPPLRRSRTFESARSGARARLRLTSPSTLAVPYRKCGRSRARRRFGPTSAGGRAIRDGSTAGEQPLDSRFGRGRLVDYGAALEMRFAATRRGFESLPLRQIRQDVPVAGPVGQADALSTPSLVATFGEESPPARPPLVRMLRPLSTRDASPRRCEPPPAAKSGREPIWRRRATDGVDIATDRRCSVMPRETGMALRVQRSRSRLPRPARRQCPTLGSRATPKTGGKGLPVHCPSRARRGTSGALYLQSAPAGLNSLPRQLLSEAAVPGDVEDRVPRSGESRTVSGPEGSSTQRSSSGAAERPGPSRLQGWARVAVGRRRVHGISTLSPKQRGWPGAA